MNVLLVGNGAREHAIAEAVMRSEMKKCLFAWMKTNNPGIAALADKVRINSSYPDILNFTRQNKIHLAIIGPEDPLAYGVANELEEMDIPTVGPTKSLARLETSKSFTRALMEKYHIPGNPKFKKFKTMRGVIKYLEENWPVVLKPDGLTGGKGVKVQGEHFETLGEALKICQEILAEHEAVVIEEKLEGEEFSLQCFCDGRYIAAMPPVQDHKRRLVGDQGPNTGGMGSYSCTNHLLPFLKQSELDQAIAIVKQTVRALYLETGDFYHGIIYGGFMVTANGIKLIEYNARFGDPEAMNVLPLLETDFLEICLSVARPREYGPINGLGIKFRNLDTVVKYVVPVNYGMPEDQHVPVESDLVQIGDMGDAIIYHSSVHADDFGLLHMTSSRAVAVLGINAGLDWAEIIAEKAACEIKGAVAHRQDIGTVALIKKRIEHMRALRGE